VTEEGWGGAEQLIDATTHPTCSGRGAVVVCGGGAWEVVECVGPGPKDGGGARMLDLLSSRPIQRGSVTLR